MYIHTRYKQDSYCKQIARQYLHHKNLATEWGVVEPVNNFLSSTLMTMQNLVVVSKVNGTMRAH